MDERDWLSSREAADYLGVTKPQIYRLIKQKILMAVKNVEPPISYYQIKKTSVEKYKMQPKNKGGRPKSTSKENSCN